MLFVMHFGWYLGLYFGFLLQMVFLMHFGFSDCCSKKKIRQGPLDPLESLCTELICYYLLISRNIWSCILFLGVEDTVEVVQLVFDFTKEISH